jgi:glutamate dehydrogenase
MTDEVGDLVLRDNYLQSQAITLIESSAPQILDEHVRFMRTLERNGRLDRAVEFLPNDETLEERMGQNLGLTRPEISVVMPYAKMWLYDQLLASELADDPVMEDDLVEYFPTLLREKYRNEIRAHRLHREIICTVVTNDLINRAGAVFVNSLTDRTGASTADIARAFIIARDGFKLADIWRDIEALDNIVATGVQTAMLERVNRLIERATIWFLRNCGHPLNVGETVAELAPGIAELAEKLPAILPAEVVSQVDFRSKGYQDSGVPAALADRVAYVIILVSACDIIRTHQTCNLPLEQVARLYFDVGERFGLGWLRYNAEKLPADTHWQKLAADAMIEELYGHQRGITMRIVNAVNGGKDRRDPFGAWSKAHVMEVDQASQILTELESSESVDLSMLAVASRQLALIAGPRGA